MRVSFMSVREAKTGYSGISSTTDLFVSIPRQEFADDELAVGIVYIMAYDSQPRTLGLLLELLSNTNTSIAAAAMKRWSVSQD